MTLPVDSRSRDPSRVVDVAVDAFHPAQQVGVMGAAYPAQQVEAMGAAHPVHEVEASDDRPAGTEGRETSLPIDAGAALPADRGIDVNADVDGIARGAGARVVQIDNAGERARWAARFGPVRWYAVLGAVAALCSAGFLAGGAVAVAGVDGPGGIGAVRSAERSRGGSSAHGARSELAGRHADEVAGGSEAGGTALAWGDRRTIALSSGGAPAVDALVATVTPAGGPTAAAPVATVTPYAGLPAPPVATVTPPGSGRAPVLAMTVTPSPGGVPGTAVPPPSATSPSTPSSTPDATNTAGPSPSPGPGITATAPATAGPAIASIYLPVALKNAELGGP